MKVKVINRTKSTVTYSIPEDNIARYFAPNEDKMIDTKELEKLTYRPGGEALIRDCFLIKNEEIVDNLIGDQEPEYWMTEEEVKEVMVNDSYDKFLDTLDFAPEGVIDIIKTLAVTLPLTDTNKLSALKRKTGFDAAAAIRHNAEAMEDNAPVKETSARRVPVEKKTERRVANK